MAANSAPRSATAGGFTTALGFASASSPPLGLFRAAMAANSAPRSANAGGFTVAFGLESPSPALRAAMAANSAPRLGTALAATFDSGSALLLTPLPEAT